MAKFRKKPVEIDAFQFTGTNGAAVRAWAAQLGYTGKPFADMLFAPGVYHLRVPTLEGETIASAGDYVIRGVEGEYYACKPGIFAQTYEPVAEYERRRPVFFA